MKRAGNLAIQQLSPSFCKVAGLNIWENALEPEFMGIGGKRIESKSGVPNFT